jgi:SpoVK/Ycf46/Vps4 family AAA+-type ATPase
LNSFSVYDYNPKKTKDMVFFPEKDMLFQKYKEFLKDDTKDKFSVLLYGDPGCGKTSLIEAFSKEFELSVITAKFDDFYSEEELIGFFHEKQILEKSDTSTIFHTIENDKKAFLFEDFDADSSIVLDRKEYYFDSDSDSDSDSDELESKKKKKKTNKIDTESLMSEEINKSQVTLKTLLNVFDGVLRFNKQVIFLTTNHIDKIDPALIRPGRMTFAIHLKEINYEDSIKLIKHNNPKIDTKNENLITCLRNVNMMPCQLEQYTNMSNTTDELISLLNKNI